MRGARHMRSRSASSGKANCLCLSGGGVLIRQLCAVDAVVTATTMCEVFALRKKHFWPIIASQKRIGGIYDSFEELFASEVGQSDFTRFVLKHHDTTAWRQCDFLKAVSAYRKSPAKRKADVVAAAEHIVQNYLRPDPPPEHPEGETQSEVPSALVEILGFDPNESISLDLPDTMLSAIETMIQFGSADIFCDAEKLVLQRLKERWLMPFLSSRAFADHVERRRRKSSASSNFRTRHSFSWKGIQ